MPVLLSTAYFPPIEYFAAMARDFTLPPLQQSLISSHHLLDPSDPFLASFPEQPSSPALASSVAGRASSSMPASSGSGMELSPVVGHSASGFDSSEPNMRPFDPVPSVVFLEACENYCKQSYRNRCRFYAASGPQNLMVPVIHENGTHRHPIMNIKVDYSSPWMQQHFKAIVSAYRTSAYFEYYQDELFAIMQECPETLFELNLSIIRFFLDKIGVKVDFRLTDTYRKYPDANLYASSEAMYDCQSDSQSAKSGDMDLTALSNGLGDKSIVNFTGERNGYESAGSHNGVVDNQITDLREAIHPKRPNTILEDLGLQKSYFQVFADKYGFQSGMSIMDLLFNEGPDSILFLKKI